MEVNEDMELKLYDFILYSTDPEAARTLVQKYRNQNHVQTPFKI